MGNVCCTEKDSRKSISTRISVRQKSLIDPETKKQYEKSLESILNQALEKFEQSYNINELKLQGLIGKGGQASVFQVDVICEHENQTVVRKLAMKRVSKQQISKEQFREALMLEKQILTTHPSCFITQVEFACQDESYLYFFMKLAIGGDCFSFIRDQLTLWYCPNNELNEEIEKVKQFKKLGEEAIVFILAGVVLGLQSLHAVNVIYRDLKPENILFFEDGYPRLADFGVAAKINQQDDMHYEMKGTVLYFAPEIVQKRGYDKSVDLWALGVLAYELVFKQPPFTTNHISSSIYEQKVYDRLKNNKWPANTASKQMKDFINKLLVVIPHKRLGYNSFQEIKDHPLFKSINWQHYQNRFLPSPLIKIISKYPIKIKTQAPIDQIIDQQDHGYLPFTFVRNTMDTQRKTVEIIPMTFVIDQHMNLKWQEEIQERQKKKKQKILMK